MIKGSGTSSCPMNTMKSLQWVPGSTMHISSLFVSFMSLFADFVAWCTRLSELLQREHSAGYKTKYWVSFFNKINDCSKYEHRVLWHDISAMHDKYYRVIYVFCISKHKANKQSSCNTSALSNSELAGSHCIRNTVRSISIRCCADFLTRHIGALSRVV